MTDSRDEMVAFQSWTRMNKDCNVHVIEVAEHRW